MPLCKPHVDGYLVEPCWTASSSLRGFDDIVITRPGISLSDVLRPRNPDGPTRELDPLRRDKPICREFAELQSTDDYTAFAKRYGLLGIPDDVLRDANFVSVAPNDEQNEQAVLRDSGAGEPVQFWREQVQRVATVLERWDFLCGSGWRGWLNVPPVVESSARKLPATRAALVRHKAVASDLARAITSELSRTVTAGVELTEGKNGLAFAINYEPQNLLGFIWLQCARIVTGQRDYRRCARARCRKWLVLGSSGSRGQRRRAHAKFCNAVCRASHAQEQKRTAAK